MEPNSHHDRLLPALRDRVDETLAGLISRGAAVAHVGYPNHWNTGDPAIWLGTVATLARLGAEVVYQCTRQNYHRDTMAERLGSGPVLIAGGGNLGDLWPQHQLFRERILADFPDNPVVQLPQSVWFEDGDNLARFQVCCRRHGDFHLLLRERQSLDLAAGSFDVPAMLCPDMAFGLGGLPRPADPLTDILWLARSDKESIGMPRGSPPTGVVRRDWLELGPEDGDYQLSAHRHIGTVDRLSRAIANGTARPEEIHERLDAAYEALARVRLDRGMNILSRGRVVITDRLHGHILCLCMEIPHVILDNRYRKLSSVYDTWTSGSPLAIPAGSADEALHLARDLLNSNKAFRTSQRPRSRQR